MHEVDWNGRCTIVEVRLNSVQLLLRLCRNRVVTIENVQLRFSKAILASGQA